MVADWSKLRDEIASLQTNIQKLKTKTFDRLTVTDELGKSVEAFLNKQDVYHKKTLEEVDISEELGPEISTTRRSVASRTSKKEDVPGAEPQKTSRSLEYNGITASEPKVSLETKEQKTDSDAPQPKPTASLDINKTKPPVEEHFVPKPLPSEKATIPHTMETTAPVHHKIIARELQPLEMIIPNNLDKLDRPLVALTMAVLTNNKDLTLTAGNNNSAYAPPMAVLGVEMDDGGGVVPIAGDLTMARFLVRQGKESANLSASEQALQDMWIDYAQSLKTLSKDQKQKDIGRTLGQALLLHTYLLGGSMTMADVTLFWALGWPSQLVELSIVTEGWKDEYPEALLWANMMAVHPAIRQATKLAMSVKDSTEEQVSLGSSPLDPLVWGKSNFLRGAIPGRVVTRKRFLPEPNGYLHLGHVKSVLMNEYYARRYKGRFIVRFDDTIPNKEAAYQESVVMEDLKLLGVEPDAVTYTSDYFPAIYGYALQLIEKGLAYMYNTAVKQKREDRLMKYSNQTPAEAKELFLLMCSGKQDGAIWCLRARMDLDSDTKTMRDPVLFRQNLEPHPRTGATYHAYPTYFFACPIVDSLEGITHALFAGALQDQESPYRWVQSTLGLQRVRMHEIARVTFSDTVLAKTKLQWFIDQGLVEGWDDARLPTIRGIVRRGVNVDAFKNFVCSQDASRRVVTMDWCKFWEANKKEIKKEGKHFMAIDAREHVLLRVTNGPAMDANAYLTTPCHFQEPSLGFRALRIGQDVLLDSGNVDGIGEGDEINLLRWGLVKITKVTMAGDNQKMESLEGVFIPNGDYKTAKRTLSWVAKTGSNPMIALKEFGRLLTKNKLEEGDSLEEFADRNTIAVTHVIGDSGLKMLQENEIIQLAGRGFFRVDSPYRDGKPIVLYTIPHG